MAYKVDEHNKSVAPIFIDFGQSSFFKDHENKHIANEKLERFSGYPAFLSRHVLELNTPSRRDDLIALILTLVYMMNNNLSWYIDTERDQIAELRRNQSNLDVC